MVQCDFITIAVVINIHKPVAVNNSPAQGKVFGQVVLHAAANFQSNVEEIDIPNLSIYDVRKQSLGRIKSPISASPDIYTWNHPNEPVKLVLIQFSCGKPEGNRHFNILQAIDVVDAKYHAAIVLNTCARHGHQHSGSQGIAATFIQHPIH